MDKVKSLSGFLSVTTEFPQTVFYRGESDDYGITVCVATANRNAFNYDMYSTRMDFFDRKIREDALLDEAEALIPFAQHSGLATKLLDVTSNPLVALYFACQKLSDNSDGYVYVFNDYADVTEVLEKYPSFDLENELLKHLKMLDRQRRELLSKIPQDDEDAFNAIEYPAVRHDELQEFGKCIEQYRNKYIQGGYSERSIARGISQEDSPFVEKWKKLSFLIEEIKKWAIEISSGNKQMADMLLPKNYTEDTPAINFVHPYREKRYNYYNDQYKSFDLEVKEYLISLECLVAFINDRSPLRTMAIKAQFDDDDLTMNFIPNLLYRPVMTFKRGLSQQSAFFVQTLFDKHKVDFISPYKNKIQHSNPRQLMKSQANYTKKIAIDRNSKEAILTELDKIGVNKATMFGDADSIAAYIMSNHHLSKSR